MKNNTKTVLKLLCSPIEADWMIAKVLVNDDFELTWYIKCLYLYEYSYATDKSQGEFYKFYRDTCFNEYFNFLGAHNPYVATTLDVILNELSYE